jgi:hypothetical protein
MIYLILTASLHTKRFTVNSKREEEYISAIKKTLSYLPGTIQPIIVENNGSRSTCLDQFIHHNKRVPVVYTDHNQLQFKSKGVNELLDLHEVIDQIGIQANDMIIKLTGRYQATASGFFKDVIEQEQQYDAFVKFYNVCNLTWDMNDCVLGCYAIRAFFLKSWNPYSIENHPSAEAAFAKYIQLCGAHIRQMELLGVRCHFSEDGRTLDV